MFALQEKKFRVNQVTIDQLRDEIKTHAHESEVCFALQSVPSVLSECCVCVLVQESVIVLESEMDEERDKCRRMVDGMRRDIEAQATEVSQYFSHW